MSEAKLTAVVVTYRSARTLPAAIEAARRCHEAGVMETIFVDNASTDGTKVLLDGTTSWARVVHNPRNSGFGQGCNLGLMQVRTPLTIFLNPDAAIEPDAVSELVRFMEQTPQAGVCGPAIVQGSDGELQVTGARPTPWAIISRLWGGSQSSALAPIVPGSRPFRCGWICGAALVIRSELAKDLGGFDPRFFLYFEETDLCKRLEERGWQIWAVGNAIANHVGSASSEDDGTRVGGCIAKHYYQSRFYYLRKHHGWFAAAAADVADGALVLWGTLRDVARGRGWSRLRPRLQSLPLQSPKRVVP